jgi:hypothetical protein
MTLRTVTLVGGSINTIRSAPFDVSSPPEFSSVQEITKPRGGDVRLALVVIRRLCRRCDGYLPVVCARICHPTAGLGPWQ